MLNSFGMIGGLDVTIILGVLSVLFGANKLPLFLKGFRRGLSTLQEALDLIVPK